MEPFIAFTCWHCARSAWLPPRQKGVAKENRCTATASAMTVEVQAEKDGASDL